MHHFFHSLSDLSASTYSLEVWTVTVALDYNDAHTHTHSVGLLWMKDRSVAETSTLKLSKQAAMHARGGIRTGNPSKRSAAEKRLTNISIHNPKIKLH